MKLAFVLIVFIFFDFNFGKPTPKPKPKPTLIVDTRGRNAQKALIQHIQQMMMILQGGAGGIGGSSNNFAMIKDKLIMLAQQMINTLQGMSASNNGGFNDGFNGRFNGNDFGYKML